MSDAPVEAALFDLDDTLYLQSEWLDGAWTAVTEAGARQRVDADAFSAALRAEASRGSDRGRIIDRALEAVGSTPIDLAPLVAAFREHRPSQLAPLPGAGEALGRLRELMPVALLTDGDVEIQRSKLHALGFSDMFDLVVFSDELGREHRKPDPAPFLAALSALDLDASQVAFVGDRPDKDIVGARRAGMRAIRVRTGEYAHVPDVCGTWLSVPDAVVAVEFLLSCARRSAQ